MENIIGIGLIIFSGIVGFFCLFNLKATFDYYDRIEHQMWENVCKINSRDRVRKSSYSNPPKTKGNTTYGDSCEGKTDNNICYCSDNRIPRDLKETPKKVTKIEYPESISNLD